MLPAGTTHRFDGTKCTTKSTRNKYWLVTLWCDKLGQPDRGCEHDGALFRSADLVDGIGYARWQRERAPGTGRQHFQIYVELRRADYPIWVNRFTTWPVGSYHVDRVFNNFSMAALYCSKQHTNVGGCAYEVGTFVGGVAVERPGEPGAEPRVTETTTRGGRTDLRFLGGFVRDGGSERDAAYLDAGLYVKYFKGLRAIRDVCQPSGAGPRTGERRVFALVGPPGTKQLEI